jgi:hypothetical protein
VTQDLLDQEEREEQKESRWEAAPAVTAVIVLQALLAITSQKGDWELWGLPWWVWLIPILPETALLVALAWSRSRRLLEQIGRRRTAALGLLGLITVANGFLLVALIGSLIRGEQTSAGQLLMEGGGIWATNVIAFGLWFWAFDRGGPVRRFEPDPPPPDFQFPQMENPELAAPGWYPELFDYLYVSFTNAVAFSPTDAMPLTRLAKRMMLAESAISAVTVLLVAARAVNIIG